MAPIELKITDRILYVNHHEGMICIKKKLRVNNEADINVLLTPYEYHYKHSIYYNPIIQCTIVENDDVKSLMSKLEQYYYRNFIHLFHTTPVPKLIVSLTNLKNAMPVFEYKEENCVSGLPNGYSVAVNTSIFAQQ